MSKHEYRIITLSILTGLMVVVMIVMIQSIQVLKLQKDLRNLELMDEILEDCKLTNEERAQVENF